MQRIGIELLGRAKRQFVTDVTTDPYLPYILSLATVLAGFWFWHTIPNFATRDERGRLYDVFVAAGTFVSDPGFESLKEGIVWSRAPFGATVYLFGLAILPVVAASFVTGQPELLEFGYPDPEFGFWPSWHAKPEWLWTWSLFFVRLFNVLFAVGCVYLTYRIGVALRDRSTGRLAAVLLTVTWGFLTIAHEGGEDMPALFFVLCALYLALRYVQTDDRLLYFAGCALGGLAIAFKLTAAPVVVVLGAAYLLRAWNAGSEWRDALARPRLLVGGAALGAVTIVLGFPTALVAGPDPLVERVVGGSMSRMDHPTGPDAPVWWWFLRGYFSALGLPLFVAAVGGVAASVRQMRDRATSAEAITLILTALAIYLLMFSRWHDFRVHHLLPTFPLLALLLAAALTRFRGRHPSVARPLIGVLLLTSGVYAGVGDIGYASMPRDEATAWLDANAPEDSTMEVYRRDLQDAAVPHWMAINHAYGPEEPGETLDPCPEYIQLGYRDLLYLKEGTYYRNGQRRAEYIRSLLDGEYGYELVAEFGPRPPNFVPQRPTPGSLVELLHLGVVPQTDYYADEQELAENQYTAILELTGECDRSRDAPFAVARPPVPNSP